MTTLTLEKPKQHKFFKLSFQVKAIVYSQKFQAYLKDIEEQTGVEIVPEQRTKLKHTLDHNRYSKLPSEETKVLRQEFGRVKNELIEEWESKTGREWGRYEEPVYSSTGTIVRRAGALYDAHHIIELSFGGPAVWWNIHPARFPDEHQAGIHRSGSPCNDIFKT